MRQDYHYYAFISYSSKDTKWGKRLQRKLEHYRMPATLCSERGWARTPIKPVFFAPTDIQPGGLTEELQERLRASRNLIVICSPNSAQSEWVGKEIEFFHQLGRTKQIHFFIVEGSPHSSDSDTECFNPIVDTLGLPEILGANVNEKIYRWPWMNKERAYVQLISKLLGVEFDTIWQRHKRLLLQKMAAWAIGCIALLFLWIATIKAIVPFSSEIKLMESSVVNENLPPYTSGIVTLSLEEETQTDTICQEKETCTFTRIPKRYYHQPVRVTFVHPDFLDLDTMVTLKEFTQLEIQRNPKVYGHVHFRLWNVRKECPVPNCKVVISDKSNQNANGTFTITAISDVSGYVDIDIPLDKQRTSYFVEANIALESSVIYMPCGEDDVLLVKEEK